MTGVLPAALGNAPGESFVTMTADGTRRLLGGFSPHSRHHHFPLASCCPYSGVEDIEAVALPATGRLLYWTEVTVAPPGYFGPVPYALGVVQLDGIDLELLSRLSIPSVEAATLGMPMRLEFDHLPGASEGNELLMWRFCPMDTGV